MDASRRILRRLYLEINYTHRLRRYPVRIAGNRSTTWLTPRVLRIQQGLQRRLLSHLTLPPLSDFLPNYCYQNGTII